MAVNFRCNCGVSLVASEAQRGSYLQCPSCGDRIAVPVATAVPRQETPQEREATRLVEIGIGLVVAGIGYWFLWGTGLGKWMVFGGIAGACIAAGRRG